MHRKQLYNIWMSNLLQLGYLVVKLGQQLRGNVGIKDLLYRNLRGVPSAGMHHAEAALIHEWAKLNLVPLEVGSRANSTLLQMSLSVAILESLHILLETLGLPLFLTELVPKFTSLIVLHVQS